MLLGLLELCERNKFDSALLNQLLGGHKRSKKRSSNGRVLVSDQPYVEAACTSGAILIRPYQKPFHAVYWSAARWRVAKKDEVCSAGISQVHCFKRACML